MYLDELESKEGDAREFNFTYNLISSHGTAIDWSMRMEHYMKTGSENIHMAAILLSLSIVVGLMCILSMLMKRGLNADFLAFFKNRMSATQRRQERAQRLPQEDEAGLTTRRRQNVD